MVTVVVVVGFAAAGGLVTSAGGADVGASTSPAGARVQIGVDGAFWEQGAPAGGSQGGGGAGGCTRRWVPEASLVPGVADYLSLLFGPPPSPEHRPFSVYCDDQFLGAVWILPTEFRVVAPGPTAAEIAAGIARDLPYPEVTIAANPNGRGLTGLAAWFWVDGYSGAPIVDAVDGFGTAVVVEARAGEATWDFGDGTFPVTATVGGSRQSPSATHGYERRSGHDPFTVTATFLFAVRYRINGGDWIDLPPVERNASRAYEVVESRGQLVASDP